MWSGAHDMIVSNQPKGGFDAPTAQMDAQRQPRHVHGADLILAWTAPASSRGLHLRLHPAAWRLGQPGRRLLERPDARSLYPAWRAVGYWLAISLFDLTDLATDVCDRLPADPVAETLHPYLVQHRSEEEHHPEPGGLDLADLAAVGVPAAQITDPGPPPPIAQLVSEVGALIVEHPVAVLGFYWLEQFHPEPEQVEALIVRTGLPRGAFKNLLLHAHVDQGHAAELDRLYDSLPLTRTQRLLVLRAAQTSIRQVTAALNNVLSQ